MNRWEAFETACALLAPVPFSSRKASEFDWETFVAVTSEHMVTAALDVSLSTLADVPSDALQYFSAMRHLNRARNSVILDAMAKITDVLGGADIEPVFLKGAASLVTRLYDDIGDRLVGDIDLLVSEGRAELVADRLGSLGFKPAEPATRRWVKPDRHHLPILVHPDTGIGVEVHKSVLAHRFRNMLPAAEVLEAADVITWNDRQLRIPIATHWIIQNVVHDQLSHERFADGTTELRQIRELAFLAARYENIIDWGRVEWCFERASQAHVLRSQATMCNVLMRTTIPVKIAGSTTATPLSSLESALLRPQAQRSKFAKLLYLARIYGRAFRVKPRLALNLFNLHWWPERTRGMLRILSEDGRKAPADTHSFTLLDDRRRRN